ncbi:MAG: CPBP family intramembrane metalloprotease [Bacteroidetes bacterium]|nr:CPBP family intramembrane metalloprotease [Bacteroidota bacterium]
MIKGIGQLTETLLGKYPQEKRMLISLFVAAFCLTGRHFGADWFNYLISPGELNALFPANDKSNLSELILWVSAQYLFLLIIPALFLFRVRPAAMHMFRMPNLQSLKIYGWLFLIMLLPLVWFSGKAGFPETYPFIRFASSGVNWPAFVVWEALYLLQFVAIEFFFRGFLLSGLLPVFGESAIAVSILPYVMIHYGKPFPEIAGAFFAGWILARLALRTGSIIPGILLHYAVALTMDLLSVFN